jgi:hypothetical protein
MINLTLNVDENSHTILIVSCIYSRLSIVTKLKTKKRKNEKNNCMNKYVR